MKLVSESIVSSSGRLVGIRVRTKAKRFLKFS